VTTDPGHIAAVVQEAKARWMTHGVTVRHVGHLFKVTQSDMALALGISRQSFNGRIMGGIAFQPWELAGIAVLLDIPREVLDLEPIEAVKWVLDNRDVTF
jgi:hypothetical protein